MYFAGREERGCWDDENGDAGEPPEGCCTAVGGEDGSEDGGSECSADLSGYAAGGTCVRYLGWRRLVVGGTHGQGGQSADTCASNDERDGEYHTGDDAVMGQEGERDSADNREDEECQNGVPRTDPASEAVGCGVCEIGPDALKSEQCPGLQGG